MAAEPDALDITKVVSIISAGVILVVISIVGMQAFYWAGERAEFERKELSYVHHERLNLEATQLGGLQEIAWVDQKAGLVSVPIDVAMDLVRRDLAR